MATQASQATQATQQAEESALTHLMALRRFGFNINAFWRVVVFAGMLLALLGVLVRDPAFYAGPHGWMALALAVCYVATYTFGSRWISGDNADTYWRTRLNTNRLLYPWRAVTLWAALLALSVAMIALNANFVWLIWIPFGMSFSLLPMPLCLLLIVPTALLVMFYYHELPTSLAPMELVKFAGLVFGLVCYGVVIYLPMILLRHRFLRERMFLQLERSHHELEEAHRQLEHAAAHERELAVLRERGRLARDMHDTLGHSLALITVKLEAAQRLRTLDPARADHEVAATQTIARDALTELRAALADLRAPGAARENPWDALVHAAEQSAARAGWRLTCEIAPDLAPVDDQTCEALLRTGLEALANIERHARAQSVHLTLTRQDDALILRVEDDGVGILTTNPPRRVSAAAGRGAFAERASGLSESYDANNANNTDDADGTRGSGNGESAEIASPPGHYGITGMRERTTGVGGAFFIGAGADGHGCRVEVRLPATRQ